MVRIAQDSFYGLVIAGENCGNMTELEIRCEQCYKKNLVDYSILGFFVLIG